MGLGKMSFNTGSAQGHEQDMAPRVPEMVSIPAGSFWMGTSNEQMRYMIDREDWASEWFNSDLFVVEQPQHQVTLPTYEIARTPVTNSEYYVFIYNTGYKVPKTWIGFHCPDGLDEHPVTGISRIDAMEYIAWLNKATSHTYRLPSEAEWEKAARGLEKRIYPWGDNFDPWRCNTVESGKKQTTPVGSYSPGGDSPFELADMVGNVWEWTRSNMQPYPYKMDDGRETPNKTSKVVVRGGAWYYSRALARCASREGVLENYLSPALGFRLSRAV